MKAKWTLLVIAFEASKIARPSDLQDDVKEAASTQATLRAEPSVKELTPVPAPRPTAPRMLEQLRERALEAVEQCENGWSTLYD